MRHTSRTIGMASFLLALLLGAAVSFAGVTYTYDSRGRVASGLNADGLIVSYVYDMAGNRLSVTSANAFDFDFDGLPDSIETGHACLDPNDANTDDDGIIDGFEDANHDGVWDQAGAVVYLFTGSGSYLSLNKTTNASGLAEFFLPERAFKFRADQGSDKVYSSVVNVQTGQEQLMEIDLD